jgi:hypothetical protein
MMKYVLNLNEDGRILSATSEKYAAENMPLVDTLPEGDISEYLYRNGEYIHDPMIIPSTFPVAPRNIIVDEYITVNGVLYKATTNIPNGASIITGQNAVVTTVEEQLYEMTKGE